MVLRATRLLVLLCCIGVSLANATPFDLPISFEVDEAQSTVFRVTVHNPSETDTLVIVPFSSPLSMDSSLSFDVIDIEAQSSLSYTGPVFTRVWPPSSESIISISARESHSAVLDLQKGFDLTAGHSYSVQPHLAAKVLGVFLPVDEHQKRHADSSLADVFTATATAGLHLRASPQTRSAPVLLRATASTTPSSLAKAAARDVPCTTSENSTIASAVALGRQQIGWVLNFVNKGCTGTGYTKWFGTVTTPNYAVVKSCVTNIDELINSNYGVDFVVVCGGSECESDTYAYVYPDDTDKHIYVCGAFWEANTGWPENDSTGGTLIHECSHFSDICGTDDHAYGTVACQELAQSNVQQAINNADSYEYFAESKPDICADTTTTTTTTKAGGSTNSQSSTSSASNTAATSSRTSASTTTSSRTSATDTTTSSGGSSGCFAASGSVRVLAHDQTVEIKSLSDIQVGDLVESVDASLKREFSQVYAVLHKESNTEEKIIQLTVEGSSIKLTPHHLLLVSSSSSSDNWQLTDASSVRTGDRLLLITDDGNTVARRVLSIHQLKAAIRAPLTLNDRIVVDGVVASVFAHSESLYSPLCAPLKFIFQHFPNLLASSPAQAALNLIVQWTDTFEARQPFQVSSFAL